MVADQLNERNVREFLEGLRCLHKLGYVHCDIEPRHLCVNAEGRPAIIDLGEARALDFSRNCPRKAYPYRGTPCIYVMQRQHPVCISCSSNCHATSRLSCMSLMSLMLYALTWDVCMYNRSLSCNLMLNALTKQAQLCCIAPFILMQLALQALFSGQPAIVLGCSLS